MLLAIILFLMVLIQLIPNHNGTMYAENIFIFLIMQAIFVIFWVAISNKVFLIFLKKMLYFRKLRKT